MKQNNYLRRILSALLLLMVSSLAWAYDFKANGVCYGINDGETVSVMSGGDYSGDIVIPSTVSYDGNTYRVTSIFGNAFSHSSALTSVYISEGVTSIGLYAFWNCSSLTSVYIPEGVTSIGFYAFLNCSALTSIDIPDGVTSIGNGAFFSCSALTSINIPESVTSIGETPFANCPSLEAITISPGNSVYDSRDNCNAIIETATNTLIQGCSKTIIPEGVTSIGENAFYGCSSLTSVTISEGVTSIGDMAFYNCSSLTSVTIPEGVTSIGENAFVSCSGLISVTIPESVTSIRRGTFNGCTSLTSVTIPESVTSIGDMAFWNCSALTSINIPEGVTSIGNMAFSGCSALTSSINIPEGVTNIGDGAFSSCSNLTSINIPESVTSIGNSAFSFCGSLTSIYIPANVQSIGTTVLRGCTSLTSIRVAENNGVYNSRNNCNAIIETANGKLVSGCKNTVIPVGVRIIGESAFFSIFNLKSVKIPDTVTEIEDRAFQETGLTSVEIPDGVISIGTAAFQDCGSLTSVIIPGSVKSIGGWAFCNCGELDLIISHIEEPFAVNDRHFGWDRSDNVYTNAILYCPNPETYKATDGWNWFANIRPLTGEEEVTLAIGEAHYATFIAPFDVEIPTNVEAYTVSGIKEDGETLQMNRLQKTIPANTPVVLYSPDIVNVKIKDTRTIQSLSYTYGLLTGVYIQTAPPIGSYVLQNLDDEVAFYYVAEGSQPAVKANRAYLTVPNANGIKAFRFGIDDETTGIQATVGDQENKAVIYDMTGRRVEKAVKGMYIIDGKKVMVK